MLSFSESNPYYPLSNYHQSPSFTTQESKTFSQQHHHQNLFHGSNPSISVTPPNYMGYLSDINTNLSSKRGVVKKKDRHTKISTAQGVRDRRVRLSISIAREFFNLQDMLGFDKASKTLGWLLGKSKAAIDELATIDRNINEVENEKEVINLSAKTIWKKKSSSICKTDTRDIRREKARERARERTRKKMMIFNLNRQMGNLPDQHHQRAQLNSMICQSSSSASSKGIHINAKQWDT